MPESDIFRLTQCFGLGVLGINDACKNISACLSLPPYMTKFGEIVTFIFPRMVCDERRLRHVQIPAQHTNALQTSPSPSAQCCHLSRSNDVLRRYPQVPAGASASASKSCFAFVSCLFATLRDHWIHSTSTGVPSSGIHLKTTRFMPS